MDSNGQGWVRHRDSIAGAVAREIERIEAGTQPDYCEGAAYKAEFDRRGSNAFKHCADAETDIARAGVLAYAAELRADGWTSAAPAFAEFEARRDPLARSIPRRRNYPA